MDFELTSEQVALADSVRRFVERNYAFDQRSKLADGEDGFSRAHWASFAELGWLGAGLAEAAGGFGGSAIEYAIIAEHLGKALALEPFAATVTALRVLEALGDAPGVADLIGGIVMGEQIAVLAHGEPASRGDSRAFETTARRDGDEWRLTGTKSLVIGAPAADLWLVSACIGDETALFAVSPDAAGVHATIYRTVDNIRVADVSLDGAIAQILATGSQVLPAIEAGIDHGTVTLCAEAVGAMDAALWMTRDYLKTRRQFGQPIGNFQALQHRMADMLIQCELARSMLYQGLYALEQAPDARRRGVSATKVIVAEGGLYIGRQAIQLHGGIGMTEEYSIGHYYKRLFVIAHLNGDQDVHIDRFAALTA